MLAAAMVDAMVGVMVALSVWKVAGRKAAVMAENWVALSVVKGEHYLVG